MSRDNVIRYLDQMEIEMRNAKKVPFSDTVFVSVPRFTELLANIRSAYDPELEKAQKILENEAQILRDAGAEASKMTSDAKGTLQKAQQDGEAIARQADEYANKVRHECEQLRQQTLKRLEQECQAMRADTEARIAQMMEDARQRQDQLVSQETVLTRAKMEAGEIIDNANQQVNALWQRTHRDLGQMIDGLESNLSARLDEIRTMGTNIRAGQMFQNGGQR